MTCFTLNVDGEILLANRFGAEFLGYQRDDLLGRSIVELYAPDDRRLAQEYLAITVELPQRVHHWDIRQLKKNGDILWMRNTARSLQRAGSRMILMTCEDIDDSYKLAEKLTHQAAHDELTGLANRKTFEKRLTRSSIAPTANALSTRWRSLISINSRLSTTLAAIRPATKCYAKSPAC